MTLSMQTRDVGFEEWLSRINSACGRFCAKKLGQAFSGAVQEWRSHALRMSVVDVTQVRLYRTQREVEQSDGGHFFVVFQLRGSAIMEQAEQQARLTAGDVTLIDASLPSCFSFQQDSRQISLLLPRHYVEQYQRLAALPCAKRINADASVVKLCHQLVSDSMNHPTMNVAESDAVLTAIATLLRPALIHREACISAQQLRFNKALALIEQSIQSDQLRPEWLAQEMGISLRSLYRLFAHHGLVVAQYIKHQRLERCAQALRVAPVRQKLVSFGHEWGFSDHSHFSTVFKNHFGVSPSEYRSRYQ